MIGRRPRRARPQSGARPDLQYVWPKDSKAGFLGRLGDIVTGKGPDVFLQKKGSKSKIPADRWGNWDSFHDHGYHMEEEFGKKSRGFQRYDPYTRKYVEWNLPHDWGNLNTLRHGNQGYPRFTRKDMSKMAEQYSQTGQIDPAKIGTEWTHHGPKRFRPEHDHFWRHAHRIGENVREGFNPYYTANPFFRMGQQWPHDVYDWLDKRL